MNLSEQSKNLLKNLEGLRLEKYLDSVGKETIGYGHTGRDLPDSITKEQAEELLAKDILWAEHVVSHLLRVPVSQNQFDALILFTFNIGGSGLATSTLMRKLNAGDYEGAAAEFKRWNKGKVDGKLKALAGLTSRRKTEEALFRL